MPNPNVPYYEAEASPDNIVYRFRVFLWDKDGKVKTDIKVSDWEYNSRKEAIDAAIDWLEEKGIVGRLG